MLRGALCFGLVAVAAGCSDAVAPLPPPEGTLELVTGGLASPIHLTAPPGDVDRLFVSEQGGLVRIVRGGNIVATPFLDLSGLVSGGSEQGLLSLAFHPGYASNGYFFVNYTDASGHTQVVRYSVSGDPDVADPSSRSPILSVTQPYTNHNGGQLAFGPDGMLYIGMGDGGSGGDPLGHGQDFSTLHGSILRIDVDGGSPYAIPPDNPYVGHQSARAETWVYGLRNPWRFSFDRMTGDLYVGDVGQNEVEEISFQAGSSGGGENFGWNTMEGTRCYGSTSCDPTGLVLPVHEYGHGDGCSVTGGFVYRGSLEATLVGRYFYADFCSSWIRSFRVQGGNATEHFDHESDFGSVGQISSFGEDGVGELYVVSLGGSVYRITTGTP